MGEKIRIGSIAKKESKKINIPVFRAKEGSVLPLISRG